MAAPKKRVAKAPKPVMPMPMAMPKGKKKMMPEQEIGTALRFRSLPKGARNKVIRRKKSS